MEGSVIFRLSVFVLLCLSIQGQAQSIVGLPKLEQKDSTTFELELKTDSAAVITVHASQDTAYSSAFIFLGRTVGEDNHAIIEMEGLRDTTNYFYRVFVGQELSVVDGVFRTGLVKK